MERQHLPRLVKPRQIQSTGEFNTLDGRVLPVMDILQEIWMMFVSTELPFLQVRSIRSTLQQAVPPGTPLPVIITLPPSLPPVYQPD